MLHVVLCGGVRFVRECVDLGGGFVIEWSVALVKRVLQSFNTRMNVQIVQLFNEANIVIQRWIDSLLPLLR